MSIGTIFGTTYDSNSLYNQGESNGLYGTPNNVNYSTFFEWFIFQQSSAPPATPTGGTWDFATNIGVPPTGWSSSIGYVPLGTVWLSIAFLDSRNPTNIVWSAPGILTNSSVYATAYADVFTGNGSTVNWTMTANPVVINNLDVSVNGVTQTPNTDYTFTGTTFTTSTPAPIGAIILVKYKQSLPAGFSGAASQITNIPAGGITSTNVQSALNELDTKKATVTSVTTNTAAIATINGATGSANVGYTPSGTGAVATTVQAKLRESVSVLDFGAACDWNGTTGTNDSASIQNAINYCITNNTDLLIPRLALIRTPLNIDRIVDGAAFDDYFTIASVSGGGIVVDTSIAMFSTSLAYVASPVTQLVRFKDLKLEATVNSLTAYVLDDNKYLRTVFSGCSFRKIRCLSSTKYVQSIYFFECQMRRWAGVFFLCRSSNYDIKFQGCLAEAGGQFALMGTAIEYYGPIGCSFIGNTIEGMNDIAIQYGSAQGLTISGNYFEGNGIDIDARNLGGISRGVAVTGNFYSHNPTTNPYGVLWGECYGCVSLGNFGQSNINNLLVTSNVQINDVSMTANASNYDAQPNSGYGESAFNPVFRGGDTANYTYTVTDAFMTRNGKQVTGSFLGTMTSTATNRTEQFYIPSLLSFNSALSGILIGQVCIKDNNSGVEYQSALGMPTTSSMLSSSLVIPANTASQVFTVRGYFTYRTNQFHSL